VFVVTVVTEKNHYAHINHSILYSFGTKSFNSYMKYHP